MERRALIAVVISLLILILYQEVIIKRLYGPVPEAAPERGQEVGQGIEPAAPPVAAPPPKAPAGVPPAEEPPPAEAPTEGPEVVVETDLFRAVLTTAGARLKNVYLRDYKTTVAKDSGAQELILHSPSTQYPLGVLLRGDKNTSDAAVLYQVDRQKVALTGAEAQTVTFTGNLEGATIRKRFEIHGDRYLWGLEVDIRGVPSQYTELALTWDEGEGGIVPASREVLFDSVLALQDGKLERHYFTDLDPANLLEHNIDWFGFSGQYFLAALVPVAEGQNASARVWMSRHGDNIETQLLLEPGSFTTRLEMFLGPKDIDRLEEAGHSLRRAVDLGWFTFVALPMLQLLRFLNRFTGNYGLDIILLTLLIKILFYPLTQKSLKSMREMQKLQPQMQKIRAEMKDKPEEMNKAIMELYRQHKVNPLGGCLPMVLQIPVFIGLYQALLNAVELRHAPFVGWINDLSAPDRLGSIQLPFVEDPGFPILTLLMGASMFLQQWMTPTTGDPTQQRVMMLMPLMFTFMFINFPAGLTLYWLVNNILTIAQQYWINRKKP